MHASESTLDMLAIVSSRYQYGPFLFFCCWSYVKLLDYWRAEENFSTSGGPPWGLRPVAFATSATWLIWHWMYHLPSLLVDLLSCPWPWPLIQPALGHTPTPFLPVKSCHLCFFPGERHLSQIFLDCAYPVSSWSTWSSLETWNLPV